MFTFCVYCECAGVRNRDGREANRNEQQIFNPFEFLITKDFMDTSGALSFPTATLTLFGNVERTVERRTSAKTLSRNCYVITDFPLCCVFFFSGKKNIFIVATKSVRRCVVVAS